VNCICNSIGTDKGRQGVDDQDKVDKEELHGGEQGCQNWEMYDLQQVIRCECRVRSGLSCRYEVSCCLRLRSLIES
jgi:hypothetical protein